MYKRVLALTAAVVVIAGCGVAKATFGVSANDVVSECSQLAWGSGLQLDPGQLQRIRDIVAKYRQELGPQLPGQDPALRAALLAPAVDRAQLASILADRKSQRPQRADRLVAMAGEIRGVLSPEQQSKAAAFRLSESPLGMFRITSVDPLVNRVFKGIDLKPDQEAAVAKLKQALNERLKVRQGQREDILAALTGFAATGDQAALRQRLDAFQPNPPTEAILDVAVALDQGQRQQLAERLDTFRSRWQQGPGRLGHPGW